MMYPPSLRDAITAKTKLNHTYCTFDSERLTTLVTVGAGAEPIEIRVRVKKGGVEFQKRAIEE